MKTKYSFLFERFANSPILPIIRVNNVLESLDLVSRLSDSGILAIEVLFRTDEAPEFLRIAKDKFPNLIFGAGTILGDDTLSRAIDSGADFLVSPGLDRDLHQMVSDRKAVLIPGAVTGSEVMQARRLGYHILKYFPAEATNGADVLAEYRDVFPDIKFIPTGKISSETLPKYAALANVIAAGGSWMTKGDGIDRIADDFRMFA